jgi:hypothetical protein
MRYQHHRPLSVRELGRALRWGGFGRARVAAARVLPTERARLGPVGWALTPVYGGLRRTPGVARALAWVSPLLEAFAEAA